MKAASLGLLLSLMGSAAWAQTATTGTPPVSPPPGATTPMAPPDNGGNPQAPRPGNQGPDNGQAANAGGPDEQYEGEIVQTPNGSYFVPQSQANAGSMQGQGENDDMQGQPGDQGPRGMGPHPHPRHPMPSKAAHFRIKAPDLALDIKCPDEEPVKACVDAVSQLIDKAGAVHH